MEYEGRICRSPMERSAYMLPVAVGCSYNACLFCGLFKHLKYRELPLAQIEEEISRVVKANGNPETVFLGDGNAFGIDYENMKYILRLVKKSFPDCKRIHMDATVTDISKKTDEQLKEMYDLGVRLLYLGIETGLDDVLVLMNKDHHTMDEAKVQIERLHKAGIDYAAHIMTGIAGKGRGIENAEAMAKFVNETRPTKICNFSIFIHGKGSMRTLLESGKFTQATEYENVVEGHRLLELIEVPTYIDNMHDLLEFRVRGNTAQDKAKMLKKYEDYIASFPEEKKDYAPVMDW